MLLHCEHWRWIESEKIDNRLENWIVKEEKTPNESHQREKWQNMTSEQRYGMNGRECECRQAIFKCRMDLGEIRSLVRLEV